jgi:hypothetical protein
MGKGEDGKVGKKTVKQQKEGLPVYAANNYPAELGTENHWRKMGYAVKKDAPVVAIAKTADHRHRYKLYTLSAVEPLAGKAAAERRRRYEQWFQQWNEEMAAAITRDVHLAVADCLRYDLMKHQAKSLHERANLEIDIRRAGETAIDEFRRTYRPKLPDRFLRDCLEELFGEGHFFWQITAHEGGRSVLDRRTKPDEVFSLHRAEYATEALAREAVIAELRRISPDKEPMLDNDNAFKRKYRIDLPDHGYVKAEIAHHFVYEFTWEMQHKFHRYIAGLLRAGRVKATIRTFTEQIERRCFPDSMPQMAGCLARAGITLLEENIWEMQANGKLILFREWHDTPRLTFLMLLAALTEWGVQQYPFGEAPEDLRLLYAMVQGEGDLLGNFAATIRNPSPEHFTFLQEV